MKEKPAIFLVMIASLVFAYQSLAAETPDEKSSISVGRYIAETSGCNDCHTTGYIASEGNVPEQDWLTGDVTGWSGPWGTTYPVNLRLFIQGFSEEAWISFARNIKARLPMPSWALRGMKEQDLRDLYRFIKSLGPKGQQAPAYMPPGQQPTAPYFLFVPPPK